VRLVRAIRPDVTVWLHQPYGIVVPTVGASQALLRRYARISGLPVRRLPRYNGSAPRWQNAALGNHGAFVVELPGGPPSARTIRRNVAAIRAVARPFAAHARARAAAAPPKPPIVWTPIPFGPARRAQMVAYAKRHYGLSTAELRSPHVIVEHYTGSTSFSAAFNTFASNSPDLGEKPGTCAHFVIDRDGTIHQLVRLRSMCRHTVGLNWTAFGIEHVGTSDGDVMGDAAQLQASLRLTRWLRDRYGIATKNVIGHNESLSSPYHRERVKAWRTQTHGDMTHATMRRYRALL
jgi:beta-N-acetylhexosaminidase